MSSSDMTNSETTIIASVTSEENQTPLHVLIYLNLFIGEKDVVTVPLSRFGKSSNVFFMV